MAAGWSARRRRAAVQAAASACLAVPLLLAGCVPPPPPAPGGPAALQGSASTTPAAPPSTIPAPESQEPPPPGTGQAPPAPTIGPKGHTADPPPPSPERLPAPEPATATPAPQATATPESPAAQHTTTAYYVLVDDGGSQGVRFGCNDSLVGLDRPADGAAEPLAAAIGALLADSDEADLPGNGPGDPAGVYNALADSRLKFLSGTFDGTTVTVYLAGALSLGGTCDVPRVEAQLTQTAVAAVGAVRAEIYVNGQTLTETLRMD